MAQQKLITNLQDDEKIITIQDPQYPHLVIAEAYRMINDMITKSNNPYLNTWKIMNQVDRNIIAVFYLDHCGGIIRSHAEVGQLLSPKLTRTQMTDHFYEITQALRSDSLSQNISQSLFKQKNFGEFVLTYLMGDKIYIYDKEQRRLVSKESYDVTTIKIDEPIDSKIEELICTLKRLASKCSESKMFQIIDEYIKELNKYF
jgi:hypothetical protein